MCLVFGNPNFTHSFESNLLIRFVIVFDAVLFSSLISVMFHWFTMVFAFMLLFFCVLIRYFAQTTNSYDYIWCDLKIPTPIFQAIGC